MIISIKGSAPASGAANDALVVGTDAQKTYKLSQSSVRKAFGAVARRTTAGAAVLLKTNF
ncbi:MAG TPA: hypothetical protein VGM58_10255 [Verrucomicrobiae bacterium]|jgi:hypothetical protein